MRRDIPLRSRLWLLIWLAGILFPIAGLRQSNSFRTTFDAIFAPDWVHVIMHLMLYGVLVGLLFFVLRWPVTLRYVLSALGAVLAVGALQEGLQAMVQPFWLQGVLYDLGVDTAGGMLGVGVVMFSRQISRHFSSE